MNNENIDLSTKTAQLDSQKPTSFAFQSGETAVSDCTANAKNSPSTEDIFAPPSTPSAPLVADHPDPQLIARFRSEADTAPQPVRARRIEIKARAGSFLHKLTREQRDQLFQWLAEHSVPKVAELVAQPPPAGFGLAVQHTTLRRLRSVTSTWRAEEAYENAAHDADSLSETIEANRIDFAPVIADLLLQKTFELSCWRTSATSALLLKTPPNLPVPAAKAAHPILVAWLKLCPAAFR